MTFSDAQVWLFLFTGVVGVLVTATTSIIAAINASKANGHARDASVNVGAVAVKVDTIEVNTNNRASNQDNMIHQLNERVLVLTQLIGEMTTARASLAIEQKPPPQGEQK